MAAEVGSAYLSLIPTLKGASGTIEKELGSVSERAGRQGGARFGKVWASTSLAPMRAIGAAAVGLFAVDKVAGFFKESIAGARESAKIGALTAQVIKTTGAAANVSADQVGKLATAISNKTGVDDEAIQSGSNMLLTFTKVRDEVGKGNNIFSRATAAATDMSVALGKDVKGSAMLVGKALNDPLKGVTALTRAGVSFSAEQKKQIEGFVKSGDTMKAQKMILGELTTQFGGAAAAAGTPADRARVAWGNFQEFLGGKMLPVMDKLSTFATGTVLPGFMALFNALDSGKASGTGFIGFMSQVGVKAQQFGTFFSTSVVPVLKDFGNFLSGTVVPALVSFGGYITGTVIPGLVSFGAWVKRNATTIGVIAGVIGTLLIPRLIVLGTTAVVSRVKQVAAWVATRVASVKSAAAQVASSYKIVAGWVMSGAAAVKSGAQTVAIWTLYKLEAVKGAAVYVAQLVRMAAAHVANGAKMAASAAATALRVVAGWVLMGVQSMIQAARMAAAWIIAMGPIGWAIAAVVGLVVLIIANWDKVKAATIAVWNAVVGAVKAAWDWIKGAASAVWGAVVSVVTSYINAYKKIVVTVFNFVKGAVVGAWNAIKNAAMKVWNAITAVIRSRIAQVRGILQAIGRFFTDTVPGYFMAMRQKAIEKLAQLIVYVRQVPGKITGFFKKMKDKMLGIGGDIVDGLKEGIQAAWRKVMSVLGSLVDLLPGIVKKALGIKSPSRVMAELGKWVGLGLAVGIRTSTKDVVAAGERMVEALRKAVNEDGKKRPKGATSALLRTVQRENKQLLRLASQREAVTKKLTAATKNYEALVKARADYASSVAESARSYAAITTVDDGRVTAAGVLDNLRKRLGQVQQFAALIKSLKAKGLNATTLDQIVQAGVESGTGIAQALATGGVSAIAETNKLQKAISSSAASLGSAAGGAMYDAGILAAAGLVRGLRSQEKVLAAQMSRLAKIMASQIKRALGIRSPSRLMEREVGKFIPLGVASGIAKHAGAVRSEMDRLAMVPRVSVASVRGPQPAMASAVAGPARGGDTFNVYSNAQDPAEVAARVAAENAWRKRP